MVPKALLQFLIILVCFSFVLSSAAVPTTRGLLSKRGESTTQTALVQGALEHRNGEAMFDKGEEFMGKRRMGLEKADYPGTESNNRHDPKIPGRA